MAALIATIPVVAIALRRPHACADFGGQLGRNSAAGRSQDVAADLGGAAKTQSGVCCNWRCNRANSERASAIRAEIRIGSRRGDSNSRPAVYKLDRPLRCACTSSFRVVEVKLSGLVERRRVNGPPRDRKEVSPCDTSSLLATPSASRSHELVVVGPRRW
jgi:hypothetical protein